MRRPTLLSPEVRLTELKTYQLKEKVNRDAARLPRSLVGNLPVALAWLALVWTLAAFGEEMAYRGYVLERAAALGRHSPMAYLVSVAIASLLFGLGHFYQGVAGVVGAAFSGSFLGALYLAGGRNLWLPIMAHGFSDTIGLMLVYLGLVSI